MAFEAVETTPMRQFRLAMQGSTDVDEYMHGKRARYGTFWCAADRPKTRDDATGLMLAPIYLGSEVPEDACCEVCHIGIRELQESMKEGLGR